MTGVSRVQFMIDGAVFSGTVEGIRIDGLFEKNMSLVYRPEKESAIKPPDSSGKGALDKDIEQQVIENQKNIEDTEQR